MQLTYNKLSTHLFSNEQCKITFSKSLSSDSSIQVVETTYEENKTSYQLVEENIIIMHMLYEN